MAGRAALWRFKLGGVGSELARSFGRRWKLGRARSEFTSQGALEAFVADTCRG